VSCPPGGWLAEGRAGGSLEYEVAAVHGIVEVLAPDVVHARGVEVEAADVRVVHRPAAGGVDQVGAVGGGQGVQGEGVLALRPGQPAAPHPVGQRGPSPAVAPGQGAGQRGLRVRLLAEDGHRRVALHQRILGLPVHLRGHRRGAAVVLTAAGSVGRRLALLHLRLGGSCIGKHNRSSRSWLKGN